jgi:hypothetical protein
VASRIAPDALGALVEDEDELVRETARVRAAAGDDKRRKEGPS